MRRIRDPHTARGKHKKLPALDTKDLKMKMGYGNLRESLP
jgi:hypothetical protein